MESHVGEKEKIKKSHVGEKVKIKQDARNRKLSKPQCWVLLRPPLSNLFSQSPHTQDFPQHKPEKYTRDIFSNMYNVHTIINHLSRGVEDKEE